MISRKAKEKLEVFKQRAVNLVNDGYSYREVSNILEVEFNFIRSHQWVKGAVDLAKSSKE